MKSRKIIGFALAACFLAACGEKKAEEQQEEVAKYNIQTLKPQSREVNYAFPATLVGDQEVNLFPQVEGRILQRHYNNGDYVKKGQKLISIDPTPYQLQVQSDEANVKAAEANLSTAKLQFESQQKLFEKKIVSQYVMKTAQNNYLAAEAQVAQAKAALAHSRTDLGRCSLVAPISGVVTTMRDDVGLLVGPGMAEAILSISDLTHIRARFSITENHYAEIFRNNHIVGTANGIQTKEGKTLSDINNNIQLRTKDGVLYEEKGTFLSVAGTVDRSTGTVQCEVLFPNPDLILHAGNSATVIFPEQLDGVLVVPQTACKKLQDKYLVFKVNANGEAEGVVVDVVPTDDGKEYILTGDALKSGDEIVADGVARIQEGQKVK